MSARDFVRFVLVALAAISFVTPVHAQCRDSRGEPVPCDATPVVGEIQVTIAPAPSVTPEPAPAPVVEPDLGPNAEQPEEDGDLYMEFALTLEGVDTRQLSFSPDNPQTIADIAAPGVVSGVGSNFESFLGGFTLTFGARPLPWLRLPQLRVSMGFGDLEGSTGTLRGALQPLTASFHSLFYLRAEIGGGIDIDLDAVRLYALGHLAIAGYFVLADVHHETLGSLGMDTFAEDAWEAGWTVGVDVMLDDSIGYTIGYRHVHTGVESNLAYFGLHAEID